MFLKGGTLISQVMGRVTKLPKVSVFCVKLPGQVKGCGGWVSLGQASPCGDWVRKVYSLKVYSLMHGKQGAL